MSSDHDTASSGQAVPFRDNRYRPGDGHLLHAAGTGDAYRVDIAVPGGAAPGPGWPLVLLLDASGCFGTCVEALGRMSRRPDATGVVPMVVAGISAPEGMADTARRRRDFTSAVAGVPGSGGAPGFLRFIEEQVKPLIARKAPLDPARQTLFGHSLAGYFTLWCLASHARSFQSYAAISPSIWWDSDGLTAALADAPLTDRQVLICLGEWEDALPPWQLAAPGSSEVIARRAGRRMLDHARAVSAQLAAIHGSDRVQFRFLPEEDHASIVSAAIPRMLRMASAG